MGAPDRLTRVNELLKRELAEQFERRLGLVCASTLVSVTEVKTSVDLRNATVSVSIFSIDSAAKGKVFEEIEKNRIAIQKAIAQHLKFKHTPVLSFKLDRRMEKGDRVLGMLSQEKEEERP